MAFFHSLLFPDILYKFVILPLNIIRFQQPALLEAIVLIPYGSLFYRDRLSVYRPSPNLERQYTVFISHWVGWPGSTRRWWVPILVASYDTHRLRWGYSCSRPPNGDSLSSTFLLCGTLGGAVRWGTARHAGRSSVRFPMVSLEFLIDIIFWPHYGPRVDPASNRNSTRNISCWVKAAGA